jgi:beta-lactamase class A
MLKQTKNEKLISPVISGKVSLIRRLLTSRRRWYLHESLIILGVIALVVVVAQLLYPTERTLPFTKVADVEVGSLTKRDAIEYLFDRYGSVELTVTAGSATIKTTTDKAGVLVDFQKAADAAARYPWWQRLIPFSLFYKSLVINAKPEITLDNQLVAQFAETVKEKCNKTAQEAAVAVDKGKIVLRPGADGQSCSDAAIYEGLGAVLLWQGQAKALIAPKETHPEKTTEEAAEQFGEAQKIIETGLTITVGTEQTVVPPETLASWVKFTDDPEKNVYKVDLDDAIIRGYMESLKQGVYISPIATTVHVLDGVETNRESGRTGRDINYDQAVQQIKQSLIERKKKVITAPVQAVDPPVRYLYNYSQSQRGLERLLADIVAKKGNYAVSVMELGGMGRTASVNGDRKYVTASTYKLFIAYMVLKDIEGGSLKWEDVITDGLNVRQCFEEMIVRSANRCALAYKARYGAANIVVKMRELGFSSVEHNTTWWATANDLATYMKRLERGQLLEGESRDYLLGLLKRQVWRYGIPTGIPGVTVADKVGFLDDYIHDIAVVYSPKGTYILSIMTKGGSYGGMADVARQVHRYMMSN